MVTGHEATTTPEGAISNGSQRRRFSRCDARANRSIHRRISIAPTSATLQATTSRARVHPGHHVVVVVESGHDRHTAGRLDGRHRGPTEQTSVRQQPGAEDGETTGGAEASGENHCRPDGR